MKKLFKNGLISNKLFSLSFYFSNNEKIPFTFHKRP